MLVGQGDAANTNETSVCSLANRVVRGDYRVAVDTQRRSVKNEFRRRVLRASEEVFESPRRRDARGDACRPTLAKPLFISKVTRVARVFPLLDRHANVNASAARDVRT